jgi:hypothetical protein
MGAKIGNKSETTKEKAKSSRVFQKKVSNFAPKMSKGRTMSENRRRTWEKGN